MNPPLATGPGAPGPPPARTPGAPGIQSHDCGYPRAVRSGAWKPSGVTAVLKKIATWAFVAFVVFYIAFRPESAAHAARWLGGILITMANGFGTFLSHLF